jgi:hypothetical protein
MELTEFTAEKMQPLVGTSWRLEAPNGQQYNLELVEVQTTLDKHVDERLTRDTFSLQFIGPPEVLLPQATYALTNDAIGGPHHIFIVPVAREPRGYRYEAVFT